MLLIIFLLIILSLIDLTAIISGYIEIPFLYWFSDSESQLLLLFSSQKLDDYDQAFIKSRDWIIILMYLSFLCSVTAAICARFFKRRRYGASQWPLTLWKMNTITMVMRTFSVYAILKKFFYDIIGIEKLSDAIEMINDGSIGSIVLILISSLLINFFVVISSIKTILNLSEWRRLNIAKCL